MKPGLIRAIEEANRIREKYNPDRVSPFPYQNLETDFPNLKFVFTKTEEKFSGAIVFDKEIYTILIDVSKPIAKQNFTVAHELGHFFLHSEILKSEEVLIDSDKTLDGGGRALFSINEIERNNLEIEANNFASNLIMPEDLVIEAWQKLKKVEDCAQVFNVSIVVMAIRLEKLGLFKE